ncbi:Scarecrow-like protein 9 [Striga hermonthica]|uniref:Scarecrow-like protein 9 n=1 Tax=Striga hermonthica TaxID=68872 RepID=A0A9N7R1U8_STRHE|nr:Scarecrow-like protein 9 [Striga hermonthica]
MASNSKGHLDSSNGFGLENQSVAVFSKEDDKKVARETNQHVQGPFNSSNELPMQNQSTVEYSDLEVGNEPTWEIASSDGIVVDKNPFQEQNAGGIHVMLGQAFPNENGDNYGSCDSPGEILRYIDQVLMEEDLEGLTNMLQESSDFKAKVKSFYERIIHAPEQRERKITAKLRQTIAKKIQLQNCPQFTFHNEFNNGLTDECDDSCIYTCGSIEKNLLDYMTDLKISTSKRMEKYGVKGRPFRKKQKKKEEVIEFTDLLITCAQSISLGDHRSSKELLGKIRKHSFPYGDGNQRMAYYFANGLEACMNGTGSQIYKSLVNERKDPSDYLRAFFMSLISSSLINIPNLVLNQLIMWPALIRRLSKREGGPPKLKITGVDFPQSGPWPAEQAEETGRRLAMYAEMFSVPFEYNVISQSWGSVRLEDLKMEEGEFVFVKCVYMSKNLPTEEVEGKSPRSMFLDLVKRINPDIFLHGVLNGAYSDPFFLTRFRDVLYHYSTLFNLMEMTFPPRENKERMLMERVLGMEVLNVIACEGPDRVERPETYRQWHVRHVRAGFVMVPFWSDLASMVMERVRKYHHKEFLVTEDGLWLLLGWRARTIFAASCWQPARET